MNVEFRIIKLGNFRSFPEMLTTKIMPLSQNLCTLYHIYENSYYREIRVNPMGVSLG
ncbi:MAG: hypothetical protein F6K06_22035 [Okeania sp. SIO1H4]|uniref:hypothetical protein n=1 Tax=Okeania sp. SIO1H5 TaxID=2607777 RepID=UPI0013C5973F|nr:hypothetical protein [Okeania sp. SIO1H5]NES78290.1 hypothetical protein [Okeania sp. SIO1H4]